MQLDLDDTIVAAASAPGGAARGIVRLSGPAAREHCAELFVPDAGGEIPASGLPCVLAGSLRAAGTSIPAALHWWPTARSYTRQPVGEFHLPGSPPLVQAAVDALCVAGARPARPGEFTLRAFLAGRLDLTQAEAVLGVIDARSAGDLHTALAQLAGGLSGPLAALRGDLLDLLAELEAGLDFAEEDVVFVAAEELQRRLAAANAEVQQIRAQLQARGESTTCPRAVLVGLPNAGKSSLFNLLVARFGAAADTAPAIVSEVAGTTRDYLTARLSIDGVTLELVDTAGESDAAVDAIDRSAQDATSGQRRAADIRLECVEATSLFRPQAEATSVESPAITLLAKADLVSELQQARLRTEFPDAVLVSSLHETGVRELASRLATVAIEANAEAGRGAVASTAVRTADSLRRAAAALTAAAERARAAGAEELVAAELRAALSALGEVVGAVYVDDVLDRIFSRFCIGK
ncbi:MAG: 50S ribosome-binding GTPase [Pirellulales bacterium]|nr:50S ribosome-binding GTPase [Pirellulales bacterium]